MRKALTFGVIALCALCALPAVALAGKKFETHVAWVDVGNPVDPDDPFLFGLVTSESRKCVKGRKLKMTDETGASLSKTADENGGFIGTYGEIFQELPGSEIATTALKKRFGPDGRRKTCLPDTANISFHEGSPRSITDFAYTPPATFTGTVVSDQPFCVSQVPVGLFHTTDGENFTLMSETGTNESGAFTFEHVPEPGSWDSYAQQLFLLEIQDQGDVVIDSCVDADSNDVVIGARRAFGLEPGKHPAGPAVIREVP